VSDWVCGRCKSINRERAATCYSCGGIRGATQLQPNTMAPGRSPEANASASVAGASAAGAGVGVGAGAATMSGVATAGLGDTTGFAIADVTMPEPKAALPAGPAHLIGGVVGGAIGAVAAAGIWYGVVAATGWQVGLVAVAVGFVVGQAVVFGARGRGSVLLVPVSVAFTLLSLVASEYLIARHFLGIEAAAMGISLAEAETFLPPVDLLRISLESSPITLLFWAIAGYQAFAIPMRALTRGT
jgi:hypothetical protein